MAHRLSDPPDLDRLIAEHRRREEIRLEALKLSNQALEQLLVKLTGGEQKPC